MKLEAAVIQGDGVGPEMMEEAVRVLQAVCRRFGHHLKLYPVLACSQAIEAGKEPLPQESLKICTQVPAVLFGNSGLKKYQDWPLDKRPEGALMILRKVLQVSTNIRPVRMYPSLKCFSPLKAERLEQGMDVAFVRDIAGGVFCSAKVQGNGDGGREAYEYEYYNETIVRKTAYTAFKLAKSRKNKVTNLDKSNVLGSSRLWRQTVQQVSEDFPSADSDMETFRKFADEHFLCFIHEDKAWELTQKNLSKATGIRFLADRLGVPVKDTYAFGDSTNDLLMLQFAGNSIAMGDSDPLILPHCTYQTTDIEDNGIANALKHFHLI